MFFSSRDSYINMLFNQNKSQSYIYFKTLISQVIRGLLFMLLFILKYKNWSLKMNTENKSVLWQI